MIEENHGVLLGQRETDFIAGASPIEYEIRNPQGNWKRPLAERQKNFLETMACVSFSGINCCESQEIHQTGKEENYSDRWIAKISGTTKEGNYLYKVGDAIRNFGLVKESSYPSRQDMKWDEYYAEIPPAKFAELKAEGQEWLKKWDVKTEFVIPPSKENLMREIKHAPIQIVRPGHAVMSFFCEADVINYFDTYSPFEKKAPYSIIEAAYKIVITLKNMNQAKVVKSKRDGSIYVAYEMPSMEYLKTKSELEGFAIPNPIPDTDSLE